MDSTLAGIILARYYIHVSFKRPPTDTSEARKLKKVAYQPGTSDFKFKNRKSVKESPGPKSLFYYPFNFLSILDDLMDGFIE
jgi:hypothetical protein